MRISGGRARGIQLQSPANNLIRPATDYLREALFSSLGAHVVDARILDLYAGTGSYGLEALSRGACHITFIENNRQAQQILRHNIANVCKSLSIDDVGAQTKVLAADALKWESHSDERYDIIIADPPYPLLAQQGQQIISRALSWLTPKPEALFIIEAPGGYQIAPLPDGYVTRKKIERNKHQPSAIIIGAA